MVKLECSETRSPTRYAALTNIPPIAEMQQNKNSRGCGNGTNEPHMQIDLPPSEEGNNTPLFPGARILPDAADHAFPGDVPLHDPTTTSIGTLWEAPRARRRAHSRRARRSSTLPPTNFRRTSTLTLSSHFALPCLPTEGFVAVFTIELSLLARWKLMLRRAGRRTSGVERGRE